MPAAAQRLETSPQPEVHADDIGHLYAQRYRTEAAGLIAGFVDFIVDAEGRGAYFARILKIRKQFISLADAEAFLSAQAGGASIVRG